MRNKKFVLLTLAPMIAFMTVFMLIPIIGGVIVSFMDYTPLRENNYFIGLYNYKKLIHDDVFFISFKNTLVFVFVTVAFNIVLALLLAQLTSTFKSNKVRSFFRLVFFLPCIAPMVATSVVWGRSILSTKNGLVNIILNSLGFSGINWLGDAGMIMISIVIYTLWVDVGYNTILFTAGIDGIPEEVYSAAALDGANGFEQFFYITLPLLGRTMTFVTIMTLISHFQMFAQFSVMLARSTPQNSGSVLTSYIYKTAFEYKDMGYASAISMTLFAVILVITIIQQRVQKVDWEY